MHIILTFSQDARVPELAVDGSINMQGEMYSSMSIPELSPWWEVDLGENHSIYAINIYSGVASPNVDWQNEIPVILLAGDKDFDIERSTYEEDVLHSKTFCGHQCIASPNKIQHGRYEWRNIGPIKAQYVRIRLKPRYARLAFADIIFCSKYLITLSTPPSIDSHGNLHNQSIWFLSCNS